MGVQHCFFKRRYKDRAYKFFNAEKVAKAERRRKEKERIQKEKEDAVKLLEFDRKVLADEDAAIKKRVRGRSLELQLF